MENQEIKDMQLISDFMSDRKKDVLSDYKLQTQVEYSDLRTKPITIHGLGLKIINANGPRFLADNLPIRLKNKLSFASFYSQINFKELATCDEQTKV